MTDKTKILILGLTGMLGHTLFAQFFKHSSLNVYATARSQKELSRWFRPEVLNRIQTGVDATDMDSIRQVIDRLRPDIVINCIGIIKQLPEAKDPIVSITVNALLPHVIARTCEATGARMIHISTDCVFTGKKGNYLETDIPDADDLYGRTKLLGEVSYPHCLTIRTSIIGHELKSSNGLVEWFLSQEGKVRGFRNAVFSGFPTTEIANIIANYVVPRADLAGLYQVSSDPINKYDLLKLIAARYHKEIEIEPFEEFVTDRSLDSTRFRKATGYAPPSWPELVEQMHRDYRDNLQILR